METKIEEVFKLAYSITKKGNYTVSVEYNGALDLLRVQVYKGRNMDEMIMGRSVWLDRDDAEENLESLMNELKQL
ncbi:MAG: hypothetical protein LBQ73_09785 [Tannerellaceae bacterium]|jgi:hypothetical protein|nr:hypothetical protein [Tannerellaceae bacterium]